MDILNLCLATQILSTRIGYQFEIEGEPTTEQLIACQEAFTAKVIRDSKLPNEISLVCYPLGQPDNRDDEWVFHQLDIKEPGWRIRGRVAFNFATCALALCNAGDVNLEG